MTSFHMSDTFFRIRRYLRNLGERDLSQYTVQYENGRYSISHWNYPEHPRPNASQLSQITINQVSEEKRSMIREYHVNDIYTFQTSSSDPTTYTVIRNNACSFLSGREIRLSNVGYYRISVTGRCQGEMDIMLINAERESTANPTVIHTEKLSTLNECFSFVSVIKTDTPQERTYLQFIISQSSIRNHSISGTIIVEYVR